MMRTISSRRIRTRVRCLPCAIPNTFKEINLNKLRELPFRTRRDPTAKPDWKIQQLGAILNPKYAQYSTKRTRGLSGSNASPSKRQERGSAAEQIGTS